MGFTSPRSQTNVHNEFLIKQYFCQLPVHLLSNLFSELALIHDLLYGSEHNRRLQPKS